MIYCKYSELLKNKKCTKQIMDAFEFLKFIDYNKLKIGKNIVAGNKIFIYRKKIKVDIEREKCFELDKRYIEIHYILDGAEKVIITKRKKGKKIVENIRKIFFSNEKNTTEVSLCSGCCLIFFPNETYLYSEKNSDTCEKLIINIFVGE